MASKRPFFHSAAIYRFGDRLLINPYARTRDGPRIGMALLATALPSDPRDIGLKVLAMLERCEDNVHDDYRSPAPSIAVILREAKLRSWRTFHKNAQLVSVFREIGAPQLTVTPSRHVGGGSEDIDEKVRVSSINPDDIGATVLAAFADAE